MRNPTADPVAQAINAEALQNEALTGAPDFMDLPDEYRAKVEKETTRRERLFWMQSARIQQGPVTATLVRRAIYAEVRAHEAEMQLAEMALICNGMKDEVERLTDELTNVSKAVKG